MDFIQRLVLFADIVDKGSISAAASMRSMTRSAVSKQLAKLEEEVGLRLLNRNTRSMSLTGPGQSLFAQAQRVRETHRETEALVAGLFEEVSGELRIASSFHFGRFYLMDAIEAFSKKFPAVVPNLQLGDQTSDIISDKIDLALRIGELKDSRLIGRKLCNNPVALVASQGFIEQHGAPASVDEIPNWPCVVYESDDVVVDQWIYSKGGKSSAVQVKPAFKSGDAQILLDACLAGYGIASLPSYVAAEGIQSGSLTVVLPDVHWEDYQAVYMVYASRRYLSPALREFISHLQLWVQQHPIPR